MVPDALTVDPVLPVSLTALLDEPVVDPVPGEAGAVVWATAAPVASIARVVKMSVLRMCDLLEVKRRSRPPFRRTGRVGMKERRVSGAGEE